MNINKDTLKAMRLVSKTADFFLKVRWGDILDFLFIGGLTVGIFLIIIM